MPRLTRRAFAGSMAALSTSVVSPARAQPSVPAQPAISAIRHDVASAIGKDMLKIYAKAVGMMMALPEGDPRSWTFQWYTHFVRGDRSKASELARIYPNPNAPGQAQAVAMWDTCQPHSGQREDFFLPWHRMYVVYLEQIVRTLTNTPQFTLPYWNYTDPAPASRAAPVEFRMQGDPTFGSLFRPNRNPGVNTGTPIDQTPNSYPINTNDMRSNTYSASAGDAGFCANLDFNLHGNVHGDTGNEVGMGSVPWAGNDPIFFIHHCNIDRVWASWNKAGGRNPQDAAFLKQNFAFVDGSGTPVMPAVSSVMATTQLNYDYDSYVPRPPGSKPFTTLVAAGGNPFVVHATSGTAQGVLQLGGQARTLALVTKPIAGLPTHASVNTFGLAVESFAADRSYTLLLSDVRSGAAGTSTGGYDVYLDLPSGTPPDRRDISFVGAINLFAAGGGHAGHMATGQRNFSFVVSDTVQKLRAAGRFASAPSVTLVPIGGASAASATIGRIDLTSS